MAVYEPIMNALLNLLQTSCGATFSYYSRRFITWEALISSIQSGVAPISQPALLLYDGVGFGGGKTKFEQRGRGRPPVRIVSRTIVIYAQLPGGNVPGGIDATTPGGTIFGPLSESVENAFLPDSASQNALTLGGLVSHCWLEGDSHWVVGDIDPNGQGMLTLPAQIMIP